MLWLDGAGRLFERYYPAEKAAALGRWREEYPKAGGSHYSVKQAERDDGLSPENGFMRLIMNDKGITFIIHNLDA